MSELSYVLGWRRLNRTRLIAYHLALLGVWIVVADVAELLLRHSTDHVIFLVFTLVLGAIHLKFSLQRVWDLNISGRAALTWLIPLVYFIWLPFLLAVRGSASPTRFGPPPDKSEVAVIFYVSMVGVIAFHLIVVLALLK